MTNPFDTLLATDTIQKKNIPSTNPFDNLLTKDEDIDEVKSTIKPDAYDSDAVGIDAWAQNSGRMTSLSNYMISKNII